MTKKIALLGSTGSIGVQTLACCKALGYRINVLAANKSVDLLEQQAREFSPRCVVVSDKNAYTDIKMRLADLPVQILAGVDGMCEAAALPENDVVCNAVVGMVGLRPTLAAIEAGKTVALANKETLVAGGQLVMEAVARTGVGLLPVDSEHSAIFQSLQGNSCNKIRKILLTASGGPFRGKKKKDLEQVRVEDALRHPNWVMGRKITIDSATMVNKGLEVMEAKWLFGTDLDQIQVVVHPQSVIHSAVEYQDGAVIAQLGTPDMRLPIQYALFYPQRRPLDSEPLDLFKLSSMTFEAPDMETFAGLALAYKAAEQGGLMPTIFNAANERAVAMFLDGKIRFLEIPEIINMAMKAIKNENNPTVDQILEAEAAAYELIESR